MNFSVLIPVYYKENPSYLEMALKSIETQTLRANEIILVKDGPLTSELNTIISRHQNDTSLPYKIISLYENKGLGKALNEGLKYCSNEWVARMDSDDIALPNRFEKQFTYLKEHPEIDVLSSWICEFYEDERDCAKQRKVPENYRDIISFSKYRNPMNHMSTVFRKEAVLDVDGYKSMNGFEDYFLWMRMLQAGKVFGNVPEVLLKARTGIEMIKRRQGWQYALDELALEKAAYQIGFWSVLDLNRNFFVRFLPRLLPVLIVEKLYTLLRKFE